MGKKALETESKFFKAQFGQLLGRAKGEYALVHGEELIETFKSKEDAIKRGYNLFGNSPFLVKQITEIDEVYNFTSNLVVPPKH